MKRKILFTAVLAATAMHAGAVGVLPLLDPNFEDNPNTAWTTFNNAFPDSSIGVEFPGTVLDPAIDGNQQLKMFGLFDGGTNFGGAFQDIAVDGTVLKTGDLVQLTGFLAHLSADSLQDGTLSAFIELTFVDTDPGGLGEFGFGDNKSADLTSSSITDTWIAASTPAPAVPVEAEFVRVKAVFIQDGGFAGGAAWVDGLQLAIVPEPSSALLLGLSGLALLRRRR